MTQWTDPPPPMSGRSLLSAAVLCGVLAMIFLGVLATDAHCEDASPAFHITASAMAGLGAVDVIQTTGCLHTGRCREGNALLTGAAPSVWALGAIKASAIGGTWALASSLRSRGHQRLGWTLLVTMTAIQGAAVTWNARQLRRTK